MLWLCIVRVAAFPSGFNVSIVLLHTRSQHSNAQVRKQPLFPGDSEWQQLLHIFKLMGTPNESMWPGVSRLRDW